MPEYTELDRLHRQLIPGQIHTPFQWIFENDSDKALITTANTKPIDCGKLAYKKDNKGIYILLSNDPIQWAYLNDMSSGGSIGENVVTRDELGTAAFKNTGTTNGTVPVIGSGNKLPSSIIPTISNSNITGLGTAATHNVVVMSGGTVKSGDVVVLDNNKKIPSELLDISELGTQVIEDLGTAAYKNVGTGSDQIPLSDNLPILDDSLHIPNKYYGFMTSDKISNSYLSIFDSSSKIKRTLLPTEVMYSDVMMTDDYIKEEFIPCLELKEDEYKISPAFLNTSPDDNEAVVTYANLFDVLDSNGFVVEDAAINGGSSATYNPTSSLGTGYDLRSAKFSIKIKEGTKYYVNVETLNNIWIEFTGTSNQQFIVHNDNTYNVTVYISVSF